MSLTSCRKGDRRQRGAAAVEFALVLPLLMALVLGAIDFGYYFFVDQIVTNAAREGARAGTLHEEDDDDSARDDAEATAENYLDRAGLSSTAAGLVLTVDFRTVGLPAVPSVFVRIEYPTQSL